MCVTVLQRSIVLQRSLNSEAVQILMQKYINIEKYIWILKYRSWIYFVIHTLRKNMHKSWLGLRVLDLDIGPLWLLSNHFLYLNKCKGLGENTASAKLHRTMCKDFFHQDVHYKLEMLLPFLISLPSPT